jgi:hypothetical protein
MPTIIDTDVGSRNISLDANIEYKYPGTLDLRPTAKMHAKLVDLVYQRTRESSNDMKKRYKSWSEVDKSLSAYIKADDAELKVKENDERKPISIVVPYSYAAMETILTYFVSAFLESPIFRYEGQSPEDIIGAILLEKVVENHTQNFKVALNLHTMFRDCLSYGMGITTPSWERKWGFKTVSQPDGYFSAIFGKFLGNGRMKKVQEETVLYEGNQLENIDPYKFFPDPNVSIHDIQKGEFVGWLKSTNYMRLLEMEQNDDTIFNVKYLKDIGTAGSSIFNFSKSESGRSERYGASHNPAASTTTPIDVVWMYVNLIPKDYGLSKRDYPEKWLFGMASDKIIICAKPMNLNHNMFPVSVAAPDFDGYSTTPISRLELLGGLQTTLDWMFNSHVANVRKAINDMLIVDPSLINMRDLEDPRPGKLIRMRRSAWGRGVDQAVKQLLVNDITRSHIGDSSYIMDIIQRTSGAVDSLSGMIRQSGERVTAQESQSTRSSALSRLTKAAKVVSIQAMFDIAYMFAVHTQQLMEQDLYIKIAGEQQQLLMQEYGQGTVRKKVTPYDLLINMDVVIKDGSINSGQYAESWVQLYQIMSNQPMLFQNFDMVRIFKHVARLMGAKDVNDFILQHGAVPMVDVKTMNQAAIDGQVQQGNMVPMQQAGA